MEQGCYFKYRVVGIHLTGGAILNKQIMEFQLNEKEKKLISMIRNIEFGEIRIIIQDRTPIRIEEFKRSIKL